MSLQRSKSAPHPFPTLLTTSSLPRSTSHVQLPQKLPKSAHPHVHFRPPAPSPGFTPRTERADPFSLGEFFPSSLGYTAETQSEEWNWLRDGEEENEDEENEAQEQEQVKDQTSQKNDELAEDAIKREDKLGVLSLDGMFEKNSEAYGTDDRLFSPYSEDEAVDHESLYLALCSRRKTESEMQDLEEEKEVSEGFIARILGVKMY